MEQVFHDGRKFLFPMTTATKIDGKDFIRLMGHFLELEHARMKQIFELHDEDQSPTISYNKFFFFPIDRSFDQSTFTEQK